MKRVPIMLLFSLVLFCSCRQIFAKRIRGNGNVTTQNRSAGRFTGIDVSGSIDVYVKQDSTPSIKVETDENLQQYVETAMDGDVLRIKTEEGFNLNASRQIKVYVSSPVLTKFGASGACNISSDGKITASSDVDVDLSGSCQATMELNAPKIAADLSGACTVILKGQTKEFNIQGSGSTTIKCSDLVADNVNVDISGAGSADVYANSKLTGELSGAADVRYKGSAQTDIHTSGASSVKKVD